MFAHLPRLPLAVVALLFAATAQGQLYKWTDEDGNVHYSDRPTESAAEAADMKTVDVDDGYGVKRVPSLTPLPAPRNAPSMVLKSFELRLSSAASANVTVGRLFYGRQCDQMIELTWSEGFLDYSPSDISPLIDRHMSRHGYRFQQSASGFGQLDLEGRIAEMRIDACTTGSAYARAEQMTGSVYLRVNWKLLDGDGKVLFDASSEGSMLRERTIPDSFLAALDQASNNLLADQQFNTALAGARHGRPRFDLALAESIEVPVLLGPGDKQFVDVSRDLLRATVTVRLDNGHGSGVFISPRHVLTNAHVVGTTAQVTVVTRQRTVKGKVIARHERRDVALIEVDRDFQPVLISQVKPNPGEPLFVIGTPLDESLSHTVTKGILSAERLTNGQSYYQTDASINLGNSGGPVFNDAGELIGISVAGIFTRDGAGMNVNYVIPIQSALLQLNLQARAPG